MKKIIAVLGLVVSFAAVANAALDEEAVEACNEMAVEQKISADEMKDYIDSCVKSVAESEAIEKQETSKEKS